MKYDAKENSNPILALTFRAVKFLLKWNHLYMSDVSTETELLFGLFCFI